jgi:hypothetical protein
VRRFLTGVALPLVFTWLAASPASASQVATDENSGEFPAVSAAVSTDRPNSLSYELTAAPPAPVELSWSVNCRANGQSVTDESMLAPANPPLAGSVPLTVKEPEYCTWSVDAAYVDFEQTGTLVLRLFAETRPPWSRCASPSWSRAASLKARDIACGKAARTVQQAIQKASHNNSLVRIGEFLCSRARLFGGKGARVSCTHRLELIEFKGRVTLPSAWLHR